MPYDPTATQIFVDTSVYLGFYECADNPVALLEQLAAISERLVSPALVRAEFERNRVRLLARLAVQFEKSANINLHRTSWLTHLTEFKNLQKLAGKFRKEAEAVTKRIRLALDPEHDPVASQFEWAEILAGGSNEAAMMGLFQTAYQRKLLGKPPTSRDKVSIGDELIWESLLSTTKTDLIVVTRDDSYHEYEHVLRPEYQKRTGKKLLMITKHLSEALKLIGAKPTKGFAAEEETVESRIPSSLGSVTNASPECYCPPCEVLVPNGSTTCPICRQAVVRLQR